MRSWTSLLGVPITLVVAVVAAGCGGSTPKDSATSDRRIPAVQTLIVFSASGDTLDERIYFVDAQRRGSQILDSGLSGFCPRWSPDRTRIVYTRLGEGGVYVANADGSAYRRVNLSSVEPTSEPNWMPDGKRLVFTGENGSALFTANVDGSDIRRIPHASGNVSDPTPSPNGGTIAYTKFRGILEEPDRPSSTASVGEIFIVQIDGSGRRQLTRRTEKNNANDTNLAWSPDGTKLAFNRNIAIYVINRDGRSLTKRNLKQATGEWWGQIPAWSPDGTKMAIAAELQNDNPNRRRSAIFVTPTDSGTPVIDNPERLEISCLDW